MTRLRRSECPKPLHNWIYSPPPLTTRSDLLSKKKQSKKPSTLHTGCHFPLSSLQEQHSQLGQINGGEGEGRNKTQHNTTQQPDTTNSLHLTNKWRRNNRKPGFLTSKRAASRHLSDPNANTSTLSVRAPHYQLPRSVAQ